MADLAETILLRLVENQGINTLDLAKELGVDHQKVVGAVKSLQTLEDVSNAVLSQISRFQPALYTPEVYYDATHVDGRGNVDVSQGPCGPAARNWNMSILP